MRRSSARRELRRLARRAVELDVDAHFGEGVAVDDVLRSLRAAGEPGRLWLEELQTSREPWFNINVGDGFYHYHRSWNDDLSMPFAAIPGYARSVRARDLQDHGLNGCAMSASG